MTGTAQRTWVLDLDGRRLEIVASAARLTRQVRLLVDGIQVAERRTAFKSARLVAAGLKVHVRWDWRGELSRCRVVADSEGGSGGKVSFTPPEGSRAARRHPGIHAARHLVPATCMVVLGLLAIAVFIKVPKPDIDLPELPWPGFLRPDLSDAGDWFRLLRKVKKLGIAVLVAVFIGISAAVHELGRKRRAEGGEVTAQGAVATERSEPGDDATAPVSLTKDRPAG